MVGPAQKLPLFGNRKMPLNKRVKILVRNKEIRTFLQRLQRTVHGSGCDALYRFFIEQTLKLAYIVTGEQLFLKVPYLDIRAYIERNAKWSVPPGFVTRIASSIARFTSSGANR